MKLKDFNETFRDEFCDPVFASGYLTEALKEGLPTFLLAFEEVAKARNIIVLENENPSFSTIFNALRSLNLDVVLVTTHFPEHQNITNDRDDESIDHITDF